MSADTPVQPRFCSGCGTQFMPDSRFCHKCGLPAGKPPTGSSSSTGSTDWLRWGMPVAVLAAVAALSFVALGSRGAVTTEPLPPAGGGAMRAPDISAMSPRERVDRLYNRVMQLWSDGKADSAAFFAPMAIAALQELRPVTAHVRYDIGLVALVAGNPSLAAAQSDSILSERPTHLLGLSLAARAAEAQGNAAGARAFRQRLLAAGQAEIAQQLPEYSDHDADIRDALNEARSR